MGTVCEVCGDIGFEYLMICCSVCKGSSTHRYCLDKVLFDGALADCWFCYDCQQRHGEDPCSGSIDKVSSEKKPGYAHFYALANQPINKRSGSAMDDAAAGRNGKRKPYKKKIKSLKKIYSPEKNSPRKKCTEKKSSVRPIGNCTNRKGHNATSIARTSAKALHSCETIGTETAKSNNGENWQVNNENSVHTWKNVKQTYPVIVNCLGFKLGDIDLLKMRRRRKPKKTSQSVTAPLKGFDVMEKNAILGSKNLEPSSPTSGRGNSANEKSGDKSNCMDSGAGSSFKPRDHDDLTDHPNPLGCKNANINSVEDNRNSAGAHQNTYQAASLPMNNKCQVHGGNRNVIDDLALEREDEEIRSQKDCRASTELQQRIVAANVTQPSSLENGVVDKVTLYSSNMGMVPKENNCTPSEHIEIENQMEYQSEPSKLLDPTKFILADSATEEENSDYVQNFGKKKPRKRRKLILLNDDDDDDDDDNEEGKAVDGQLENASPRSLKYDGPIMKQRVDTEYYVEAAALTGDFRNENPDNGRPVKKQRGYINFNKDEDAIVGAANSDFALDDVTNYALNDGTNMTLENVVANDHCLQSRMISNSESADLCIYSQPADEPIRSVVFTVHSDVSVKMDVHLSNKACQKVWEFSKSLPPVLEVEKVPWLQVRPKKWRSSGPTHDCIGLFFFPHNFRANEVSNELMREIIEGGSALKLTAGIADLLIFPSTILPEQNHLYQGKHYLWGVFKRRKDMSDKGVVAREQDGTAQCKQQEHNFLDQQDGSVCASEKGELQEEHHLWPRDLEQHKSSDQDTNVVNHVENQQLLMEFDSEEQMEAMKIPIVGSDSSMHSKQTNQLEGITSSPEFNAPSAAEPSAEGDRGQSCSGSDPPTTKLFGIVVAQTPKARLLLREMASQGALVFPVQEETVIADYTSTRSSAGDGSRLNPEYQNLLERSQPFDFISTGLDDDELPQADAVASDGCLELFPIQEEEIGRASGAEARSMEVDLELSLSVPSRPTPVFQL